MKRTRKLLYITGGLVGLVLILVLLYQLPVLKSHLAWRVEGGVTYLRGMFNPAGQMPTALPQPRVSYKRLSTPTPEAQPETSTLPTAQPTLTPTVTPTLAPLPPSANLPAPKHEPQDQNNCGPATLAMYLRYYGWSGTQYDITDVIKPMLNDRNVNVDELIYFVRTHAGWLHAEYRVGGTIEQLKRFIAAGLPVMIEESSKLDKQYWPGDDLWAGHYLLLTGYDDARGLFITQDSWLGPDLKVTYAELDKRWKTFNRVYIPVYPPEQENLVRSIIGEGWDEDTSRANALETAEAETVSDPKDPFAWFNLGTNLVYFKRYGEAAQAFDTARTLKLPQRMLRYQFGPFIAYFNTNRNEDLKAVAEYALKITPNSEEAHLWMGWALFRAGDRVGAVESFQAALEGNQFYSDAQYALNYVGTH